MKLLFLCRSLTGELEVYPTKKRKNVLRRYLFRVLWVSVSLFEYRRNTSNVSGSSRLSGESSKFKVREIFVLHRRMTHVLSVVVTPFQLEVSRRVWDSGVPVLLSLHHKSTIPHPSIFSQYCVFGWWCVLRGSGDHRVVPCYLGLL